MRIGEILDAAVKIYRLHWKTLMGIVACVLVPYAFIESFAAEIAIGRLRGRPLITDAEITRLIVFSVVIVLVSFLFVQPFLAAAMARAASGLYLGETPTIGGTYRFALSRTASILWVIFLTFLAVVGGLILLIVPGIILYIRFAFAPTVVIVEGSRGRAAMRRSWRLSRGFFWKILGTLILVGLGTSVVASLIQVPLVLAAQAIGAGGWPLEALGTSIGGVVTTPFSAIVTVLLYFDLRIRREGLDLALMAQELGRPP